MISRTQTRCARTHPRSAARSSLATKPQDVFITRDRLQPTEHDQPVPIGQPRPVNATGPLSRQTMFATLHELGAAAVLRPSEGHEGTMFVLGNRASTPENFERIVP